MINIGILNLGINNIKSITKACEEIGKTYILNDASDFLVKTEILILPGNGNFEMGIKLIKDLKFDKLIYDFYNSKKKIITICLGLHLLMNDSEEAKGTKGLSLIKGSVKKIDNKNFKIPLLGWYDVNFKNKNFKTKSFFFNNSFKVVPEDLSIIEGEIINDIPAFIKYKNLYGFQFHPEKSSFQGLSLLKKIIEE